MIKIKTLFLFLLTIVLLTSCGYTPQYSKNNNFNFSIEMVQLSGDRDFNNFLEAKLKPYSDNKKSKIKNFEISTNSNYEKKITLKDSSGSATEYELKITVNFQVHLDDIKKEIKMIERFNMKKMDDTFEQSNYERSIKDNFANIVKEKLIFYILEIQ